MTKQLVSIIMPVWNGENWVAEAIESALQQSYTHWELLVVDNGSSDHSLEIIQQFNDPRIRLFQQAHSGVSNARNLGLDNANGDFICFLDCDDELPPQSLATRVDLFYRQPKLGFADGIIEVWNADFSLQSALHTPTFSGEPLNELRTLSSTCFYGITWMIRAEAIGNKRFNTDMSHSEDLAFFATVSNARWCYDSVGVAIYKVRKRAGSAMSDLDGLAKGYEMLFTHLTLLRPEEKDWQPIFRSKVRRILFRSFIKKYHFFRAFRSLSRWS